MNPIKKSVVAAFPLAQQPIKSDLNTNNNNVSWHEPSPKLLGLKYFRKKLVGEGQEVLILEEDSVMGGSERFEEKWRKCIITV